MAEHRSQQWNAGADLPNNYLHRAWMHRSGIPFNMPVLSLGETQTRPTAMLVRNLAAMEIEETAPPLRERISS